MRRVDQLLSSSFFMALVAVCVILTIGMIALTSIRGDRPDRVEVRHYPNGDTCYIHRNSNIAGNSISCVRPNQ